MAAATKVETIPLTRILPSDERNVRFTAVSRLMQQAGYGEGEAYDLFETMLKSGHIGMEQRDRFGTQFPLYYTMLNKEITVKAKPKAK